MLCFTITAAVLVAACGGTQGSTAHTIWKVGDAWKVTVRQDSAVADPTGKHQAYDQVYRFTVSKGPSGGGTTWQVTARMVGAEGPFARGFRLYYAERGAALVLTQAGLIGTNPVPASAAPAVLGQSFPLEKRITKRPTDRRIVASKGGAATHEGLPPTSGADSGAAGTTEQGGPVPGDAPTGSDAPPTAPPG